VGRKKDRRGLWGQRGAGVGSGYTSLPNTVILMDMRKKDMSGKILESED